MVWLCIHLNECGTYFFHSLLGFIRPRNELPSAIELSFYSNILLPHIALDSLVCICASLQGPKKNLTELIEVCLEYCDMLKYEFVFTKPCICLTSLIKKSIEKLRALGIIHLAEVSRNFEKYYESNH
jgi:glycerol-3-phosphate O-acyltransferase 1/2